MLLLQWARASPGSGTQTRSASAGVLIGHTHQLALASELGHVLDYGRRYFAAGLADQGRR
ncbi:MAG TPA: hypothetical protein VHY58_21800 [Streptosporangiaceae bacterium]|nr:hypothetical protein [Streptosporangiaceae bacterium]